MRPNQDPDEARQSDASPPNEIPLYQGVASASEVYSDEFLSDINAVGGDLIVARRRLQQTWTADALHCITVIIVDHNVSGGKQVKLLLL